MMSLERFENQFKPPFGAILLALPTVNHLIFQLTTYGQVHEFASHQGSRLKGAESRNIQLAVQVTEENNKKGQKDFRGTDVECWYCKKAGHVEVECF